MRIKFFAKIDEQTQKLLADVRKITGLTFNDELLKFMSAFIIKSYIDSQPTPQEGAADDQEKQG